MIFSSLLLLSPLLSSCQRVSSHRTRGWGVALPFRGGTSTVEHATGRIPQYTSVGVIDTTTHITSTATTTVSNSNLCDILYRGPHNLVLASSEPPILQAGRLDSENPLIVAETMGLVCDIVVFRINPTESHTTVVDALMRGIRRRVQAGMTKPNMIVVVVAEDNQDNVMDKESALVFGQEDDNVALKQRLVSNEFQQVSPQDVSRLEIVSTVKELDQVLEEELLNPQQHEALVERDAFSTLIQQVYNSLSSSSDSSSSCQVMLEPFHGRSEKKIIQEVDDETVEEVTQPKPIIAKEPTEAEALEDTKVTVQAEDKSPSIKSQEADSGVIVLEVLSRAKMHIQALQQKQETALLQDQHGSNDDFARDANRILEEASQALDSKGDTTASWREPVLMDIANRLQPLYMQHLEMLRDYYGRRYEESLEEEDGDDEDQQVEAAKRSVDAFRAAAQGAIPMFCQQGELLYDITDFDYVSTLNGLLSDMMEATSMTNPDQEDEIEEEETSSFLDRHKVPKWLQKLGARALVMGINYLQGWLAWQGIRKAAEERDLVMPKFPLY